MQVDLTPEQVAFLVEVLEQAHGDLRAEVYKTEGDEWKRALKQREEQMVELIRKLKQ